MSRRRTTAALAHHDLPVSAKARTPLRVRFSEVWYFDEGRVSRVRIRFRQLAILMQTAVAAEPKQEKNGKVVCFELIPVAVRSTSDRDRLLSARGFLRPCLWALSADGPSEAFDLIVVIICARPEFSSLDL